MRVKSDLFGTGRVSLPVLFARGDDGSWHAKWMHLGLTGHPQFNRVEGNARSTSQLVRAIAERRYLQVSYLEDLLRPAQERRTARSRSSGSSAPTSYRPARPSTHPRTCPSC